MLHFNKLFTFFLVRQSSRFYMYKNGCMHAWDCMFIKKDVTVLQCHNLNLQCQNLSMWQSRVTNGILNASGNSCYRIKAKSLLQTMNLTLTTRSLS